MASWLPKIRWLPAFAVIATAMLAASEVPRSVGVAVVRSAPWSAGDSVRDGAGEFAVLLRIAQLQRAHLAAGLVCIGDRDGILRSGGERALRRTVLTGVVVVKLAPGGVLAAGDEDLFLDGGALSEDTAREVLSNCLARYGSPPMAADPERATKEERAAIHAHLSPFRATLRSASVAAAAVIATGQ